MFKRVFTAALVMGAAAMAPPAQAQSSCAMRDTVVERLEKFYSEAYQGGGLQNATSIIEIWSSAETGSWTVLVTRANGISCIVASGHNWQYAPEEKKAGIAS